MLQMAGISAFTLLHAGGAVGLEVVSDTDGERVGSEVGSELASNMDGDIVGSDVMAGDIAGIEAVHVTVELVGDTVRFEVLGASESELCRETLDNCIVGVIMEATMTEAIKTSKRPNRMRRCQTQSQALVASFGHRVYRFPDLNCTEPSCCTSHSPSSLSSVSRSKLG